MYLCRTNAMDKCGFVFGRGSCLRSSFLLVSTFVTLLGVICGRQIDDFPLPKSPITCGGLPDHCTGDNFYMPWSCPKSSCFPNYSYTFDNKSMLSANLSASVYYRYHNSKSPLKCQKVLNLTWTVKLNDFDPPVVGFMLRHTRVMLSKNTKNTSELQFFLKQEQNMPVDKNGNTMFYYDCLRLSIASNYQLELFSLQRPSPGRPSELLAKPIGATNLITDCDVYPAGHLMPNSTYRGYIHVGQLDRECGITAYFTPASDSFGFEAYNVQMVSNGRVIKEVKNLAFTCENFGPVSFKNVVPGNYNLTVIPVGGRCPQCIPYQTPFNVSNSSDVCQTTTATYRETTTTKYRETTAASSNILTLRTSDPTTETPALGSVIGSTSMVTESAFRNQSVIIAVAAVIFVSVIVLAVVFLRHKSRKRRGEITVPTDDYYSGERDAPGDDSLTRQPVVLIYASDNRFHNNVVQCLAAYLQTQCHCDVRLDQWCQTKISEISALEWILRQLKSVENVIIINSEGGFRQCTADTMGFAYEKVVHETPLEDMFLPAMRELRNGYYLKPKPRKLFKVTFPYTDPDFCLSDFHSGISYQLMTHIEDLVLNIHGLSKHSRKGKTTMVGINQKDYTTSPEGCALEKAIREATDYYKQNPNWFSEFYQVKTTKDQNNVCSSVDRDWATEHLALQNVSLYKPDPPDDYDSGFGKSLPEDHQMDALFKAPDLDDASSVSSTSIELQVDMFNKDYDSMLDP